MAALCAATALYWDHRLNEPRIILKALLRNAFKIILGLGLSAKRCKIKASARK